MADLSTSTDTTFSYSSQPAHPLRPVFIAVLAAKVLVAAFLLTTVSMAPPVAAESSYAALN
ncbi:hypothetical protein [Pseudorhizobium marinum]|uniref:hypothetical protein n=1 Tax=Pseudorhizobium marinum TaxID=1496690 RepID=UPI000496EDE3|nr:hypothetical protein [Pseudorhizobium marinum]MBU1315100.1 hypothetical protein [Alphaproteobacteria bacterium]MBU1550431.1 hypothetical protein [Alphaproteobacteria bacterium]MBU2338567.1 hypothetical protein [Alphaproteobacteria bacterium]MBU2389207.1 hypothetical protein [Alphaproteobacteria bacterium]